MPETVQGCATHNCNEPAPNRMKGIFTQKGVVYPNVEIYLCDEHFRLADKGQELLVRESQDDEREAQEDLYSVLYPPV